MPTIEHWKNNSKFKLPAEEDVVARNQTITGHYAKLYQLEPHLYKWAGMAAFASFHIGKKLQMLDWKRAGIRPLSTICDKDSRSLEDDFQVIRIVNNTIFDDIGWVHLAFCELDFLAFEALLSQNEHFKKMLPAFKKLNQAREQIAQEGNSKEAQELVWEANCDILWHEQSEVVQPLFDRLSNLFARAMTFCASFDYKINWHTTNWKTHSRFISFMLFNGFDMVRKTSLLPVVTNLEHRWFWISNDLLKKWKVVEADYVKTCNKIEKLTLLLD